MEVGAGVQVVVLVEQVWPGGLAAIVVDGAHSIARIGNAVPVEGYELDHADHYAPWLEAGYRYQGQWIGTDADGLPILTILDASGRPGELAALQDGIVVPAIEADAVPVALVAAYQAAVDHAASARLGVWQDRALRSELREDLTTDGWLAASGRTTGLRDQHPGLIAFFWLALIAFVLLTLTMAPLLRVMRGEEAFPGRQGTKLPPGAWGKAGHVAKGWGRSIIGLVLPGSRHLWRKE